jgi:hypothetical protein
MKISIRLLIFLWAGLFLVIGALLFNAYSKFKPENFIALLTEQVQENYPNTKLMVGNVSYRFSLDFNLNLQNIKLTRESKLLGSIGEIELKVPWWLLLMNSGNAQINIKDMDIFVDHHQTTTNQDVTSSIKKRHKLKISLPEYLLNTKYTLRAYQVSVKDIETGRRYFSASKLMVRDFQYGKNSAFELNIPISITHNNNQYSSDLWLFGDITPQASEWYLNFRGEFRTKENGEKFQFDDLVIGGYATFFPRSLKIDSDVNFSVDKRPVGYGHLDINQEFIDLNVTLTSLPLNYLGFVSEEIKNPYLDNYQVASEGEIKFKKMFDSSLAKVSGKLSFDGEFKLSEKDTILGKWQVSLLDSRWELSFMSPNGNASFFRRSLFSDKKNTMSQYVEEIGFSGLDLGVTISSLMPLYEFVSEDQSSYFTSTINFKKCLLGDQVLDGTFKYGVNPDQKFYFGDIHHDKSNLTLNFENKGPVKLVDVKFKNFKWDSSYNFLKPFFNASKGTLNGNIQGQWIDGWEDGKWVIQVRGNDFLQTQGRYTDFISQTLNEFEIDENNFENQNLNLSGMDGKLSLNALELENVQKIKISGKLNSKLKSYLTLSLFDKKNTKTIKKEVIQPYWIKKDEI